MSDFKDEALDRLAADFNVAQFVSFGPGSEPPLRFARQVERGDPGATTPEDAIRSLLACAPGGTLNVRTFRPGSPKGNPFQYGLGSAGDVASLVRRFAADGYHVIVNETIDVKDGGVSGVRLGGVTEFAPGGTPRLVEEAGVCSLDDETTDELLATVYEVRVPFPPDPGLRVEFSVHPNPSGIRRERWIVWEVGRGAPDPLTPTLRWPNRFSRHIGDKAFGLLVAHLAGIVVPRTHVLSRAVAPFTFGSPAGLGDRWLRTCPADFTPGTFPTVWGWTDPFRLMDTADPDTTKIASLLVQDGVDAKWSGAARSGADHPLVEGVAGMGDRFMLGLDGPAGLPGPVENEVVDMVARAERAFGPIRAEWVADGERVWLVQLNQQTRLEPVTVVPGVAHHWMSWDPQSGLDSLRSVIQEAQDTGSGIELTRPVGLTSHVGDLLRAATVPARFADHSLH